MERVANQEFDAMVNRVPKSELLPKILIYSGHDSQITPILNLLAPHFDIPNINYASSISFELRLDNNCKHGRGDAQSLHDCFKVRVSHDG